MYYEKGNKSDKLFACDWNGKRQENFFGLRNKKHCSRS